MADQEDRVPEPLVVPRLGVHLGDERARRVDRPQTAHTGAGVHRGCDSVRREDDQASGRHFVLAVDEDGAALLEVANDMRVVDDLLANIDRGAVELECLLHGLDCPLDAGAIAPGRGEDQPFDHRP